MLYINVFRWNLEKNDTDEPICKAEIETQMYRTNAWTPTGERGQGGMNSTGLKHLHHHGVH